MIVSASRRTDIPAFHSPWFMEQISAGWTDVVNPFNPRQVSRVSLSPEDVSCIVFWTRDARPLFPRLDELEQRGFDFYFQFTVTGYPRRLEPSVPGIGETTSAFHELAERAGPERIAWRYDPVILSSYTPESFHLEKFSELCDALSGSCSHCIVSFIDLYRKAVKKLFSAGIDVLNPALEPGKASYERVLGKLAAEASRHNMEMQGCVLDMDAVKSGGCIDRKVLAALPGKPGHRNDVPSGKGTSLRPGCLCSPSRDIGRYGTCGHGCLYCYAS